MDLTKAEAIAKIIEAKSEDGVKLLARALRGELKTLVDKIRHDLIEILAFIEVNIDYAEEDLPEDIFMSIKTKLDTITAVLTKTFESSKQRDGLLHGFHVAIIGKPNVGKSSLLNALLNEQRAIISDIAGTTRDAIEEELKLGTHLVKIIDTAGIRQTSDEIEKIGVQRSKKALQEANIILALFDSSRPKDSEDEKILNLIDKYKEDKKVFFILNKCDLKQSYNHVNNEYIYISCHDNIKPITEKIISYLDTQTLEQSVMLTTQRQLNAVQNALSYIQNAHNLLHEGSLELFAFEIKEALIHISSITKIYDNDEMLDAMFSNFCLGK